MPDLRFTQHATYPNPLGGAGLTLPSELGYNAMSVPPETVTAGVAQAVIAGTLALRRISLPGVIQVNSVTIIVSTGGTVMTANQNFLGVWDGAGDLVALSGDLSAVWNGTGSLVIPVTPPAGSPGNAIDTPYCYVGWWWNGTSAPFLAKGGTIDTSLLNGAAGVTAGTARAVSANAGLTTAATAPVQLGALTKIANTHANIWAALS